MKTCKFCKKPYKKPGKFSETQWALSRFCSMKCFGKNKLGSTHTVETRKKLSLAHVGTKKPWAGLYKHSDTQKAKGSASLKKFYLEHPEERLKISQRMKGRKHDPETIQKMVDGWKKSAHYKGGQETRQERKRICQRQRQAKKYGNGGEYSLERWSTLKREYSLTCPSCLKSEPEIKLTIDHIVPISKGGKNESSNIQPLCFPCNLRKGTKIIKHERIQTHTQDISTK